MATASEPRSVIAVFGRGKLPPPAVRWRYPFLSTAPVVELVGVDGGQSVHPAAHLELQYQVLRLGRLQRERQRDLENSVHEMNVSGPVRPILRHYMRYTPVILRQVAPLQGGRPWQGKLTGAASAEGPRQSVRPGPAGAASRAEAGSHRLVGQYPGGSGNQVAHHHGPYGNRAEVVGRRQRRREPGPALGTASPVHKWPRAGSFPAPELVTHFVARVPLGKTGTGPHPLVSRWEGAGMRGRNPAPRGRSSALTLALTTRLSHRAPKLDGGDAAAT
jgi:hypothetical protein